VARLRPVAGNCWVRFSRRTGHAVGAALDATALAEGRRNKPGICREINRSVPHLPIEDSHGDQGPTESAGAEILGAVEPRSAAAALGKGRFCGISPSLSGRRVQSPGKRGKTAGTRVLPGAPLRQKGVGTNPECAPESADSILTPLVRIRIVPRARAPLAAPRGTAAGRQGVGGQAEDQAAQARGASKTGIPDKTVSEKYSDVALRDRLSCASCLAGQ
jgi:hypothetical protein